MAEDELYLWNQARALELLAKKQMICRVCGQGVSCYPVEAGLRHRLTHAQGKDREEIEEMLAFFTDLGKRFQHASGLQVEVNDQDAREFVSRCLNNGILVRVPDKE